jgi:hypothetical protein
MQRLTRQDLLSLEQYSERRAQMRRDVIAHKRDRHIQLGAHVRLLFEDRLTIQYQIQEMLRTERIFEAAGIQEELDAYNPLIPDGDNWKATMLIEYEEVTERRVALERLKGIEDRIYIEIGAHRIYAIADEDMERANDVKNRKCAFFALPARAGPDRSAARRRAPRLRHRPSPLPRQRSGRSRAAPGPAGRSRLTCTFANRVTNPRTAQPCALPNLS